MCVNCPLSIFVRGTQRMVRQGYACGATGGACNPSDKCEEWIKEYLEMNDN